MKQALEAQGGDPIGACGERRLVEVVGGGHELPRTRHDAALDKRRRSLVAARQDEQRGEDGGRAAPPPACAAYLPTGGEEIFLHVIGNCASRSSIAISLAT